MKKNIIFLLIISFILSVSVVRANNDKVIIEKIDRIEKSDDVLVKDPVINGYRIDFDIKFKNVGDFVKYRIIVNNKDSEDYTLSPSDRSDNNYISYEYLYEDNNKVIVSGARKALIVVITYNKEIPDNLFKDGVYSDTHSTSLSFYNNRLPEEEMKRIENPKTGTASVLLIMLTILLSFMISLVLSNRKVKRYLNIFILFIMLLSPIMVYAISNLFITINSKVEVVQASKKVCFYNVVQNEYYEEDVIQGESPSEFITRVTSTKGVISFYNKEIVDCFRNNYSKGDINVCLELLNNYNHDLDDSIIKTKEEGCYIFSNSR